MLFKLLFFLVSVGLLIRFWYVIPIAIIPVVLIAIAISRNRSKRNTESPEVIEPPDTQRMYSSTTYKISSTVSPSLYNEITQYCSRNRMTVSELIRKAVRAYMDSN